MKVSMENPLSRQDIEWEGEHVVKTVEETREPLTDENEA